MNKLLNRPLKAFTLYALLVLACSIPVYYFIVDYIWRSELDEYNEIVKSRIESGLNKLSLHKDEWEKTIALWNKTQPGTKIEKSLLRVSPPDSIYTIMRGKQSASEEDLERYRGLSSYIKVQGELYHLTIEINVEEAHETVFAIAAVTVLFFIILLAGFVILNRRIATQIWKPFHSTLDRLKSFDLNSQNNINLEKSDIQEFEQLNQALYQLIAKNISVFRQQKEFTENASHELQTPLAVLKSKIDLLMQNESLTESQSELIASLNMPLSRVSRINKNLLLLAKIENQQFAEDELINMTELVNQNLEFLGEHLIAKNNTVEMEIDEDSSVTANKSLVEIMLVNLLLNAIRHSQENGTIRIKLTDKDLIISNTGNNPLNKDTLFKRFITSSSNTPSSGLGLAIVKEIAYRYNWQVEYQFVNYFHQFSIHFRPQD
ncbi:sensor histidine kinase [Dyadobacter subterraneus]|uniref:histidine kinase n=1 Tax=Dyadobacter subterraneus TaxID=2773304 RepID=A0ABR9WCF6_9BACT|nr:HAMP domain-containing sensor histidine kinase [Dyadobacter subterraneus]MBE9463155.1 HAMP domain-containing histidine kinase [Dyadobacter subterraneus]